jgi:RimJ/RimL family protein N-acetyltransferase
MMVPVLETPRLKLRAHGVDDFPALMSMWSDDAVTHYISSKPMRPDECWTRLLRYRGLWPLLGYGYWAIEEKASGRFAGDVGFGDFHRMIEPSIHGIPEMGWALDPSFHGKGYASEAAEAAVRWFDREVRMRSVCIIDPGNQVSQKLAAKNGFRETCRTLLMGTDVILFERPRSEAGWGRSRITSLARPLA